LRVARRLLFGPVMKNLLLVLLLTGCNEATTLSSDTYYASLADGFTTLESCQAAAQGSVFNCQRSLSLCRNGGFTLLVTDIINLGRYTQSGNQLTATLSGAGDAPAQFTATLNADGTLTSKELAGQNPWEKQALSVAEEKRLGEDCAAFEQRN
jgi:hypothetical protein